MEIFSFESGSEGWTFQNPSPFGAVNGAHDSGRRALGLRTMATDGFAYWESPMLSPAIVGEGIAYKTAPGRTLFRSVWRIASDAPAASAVPGFRLRQSSPDFEQTDLIQISSTLAPGDPRPVLAPSTAGREYSSYFLHPTGTSTVRLDFDVVHFAQDDAQNSSLFLEQVNLQSLTEAQLGDAGEPERMTFSGGNAHGWTPRTTASVISAPAEFAATAEGLLIRGRATGKAPPGYESPDRDAVIFGYWGHEMPGTVLRGGRMYRIDWQVASDAPESRRGHLPAFRLRFNTSSHQLAALKQVESRGDASLVPSAGQPVVYSLFVEVPPQLDGDSAILSFDYLHSPSSDDDPELALILREVAIREIGG